jgi:hypothetical protein
MQLESLRDPQVIARRAQQLGMRVPAAPLFLDLSDGSIEGDPVGARIVTPVLLDPRTPPRPAELDPPTTVVPPPEGVLSDGQGDGRSDDQRGAGDRADRDGRNASSGQRDDDKNDKNKQDTNKQDTNKQGEKKNKSDR